MRARPRFKHRPGAEVIDLFPRDRVRNKSDLSAKETAALIILSISITGLLALVLGA